MESFSLLIFGGKVKLTICFEIVVEFQLNVIGSEKPSGSDIMEIVPCEINAECVSPLYQKRYFKNP